MHRCATQKVQSEKVIDSFDDDSVGSVSDVREFCENASLSNESHAYMDKRNATDNDVLTSQSFNTFPENSTDACTSMESENTMQSNMDDIENIEDIEDNMENIEDIENIALHVDGNIDANHL